MKKFIIIPLAAIVFIACNNNAKTDVKTTVKSDSTTINKAAAKDMYTCPMDTDVHSDKPGKCPKCGMELEKKAN